jgi:site-specific recombinase XerD
MIVNLEKGLRTQRAYKLFVNTINSPRTLMKYDGDLLKFMKFAKYSDYDSILLDDSETIQKYLEDYVMEVKTTTVKRSTVKGKLQAIELFLEVNKKMFYKKALHLMYPKETTKKGNEYPYSNEDVLKLLNVKSKRSIALIHFFASTGARPAVIDDPVLKFKNIHPMQNGCKAVFLYDESNEEYWGFLTPEASKALDDYVDERIFQGEKITQNSPVFIATREKRLAYNPDSIHHLDHITLTSLMNRIRIGARMENHKTGNRFEKGLFLGFRKRFNTILKIDSEINSNITEKLMAHKRGLDGVYFKPTKEDCFREFQKAIPQLTLSESERLKLEVNDLTENKDGIIKHYEERLSRTEKLLTKLLEKL